LLDGIHGVGLSGFGSFLDEVLEVFGHMILFVRSRSGWVLDIACSRDIPLMLEVEATAVERL
jgi:hypothetical protein